MFLSDFRHSPYFDDLMIDAASYDRWAGRIAAGDLAGDTVFYQAPLYPYFLGSLYALLGRDLMAVRVVQALIGSLTCVLLYFLTRELFSRREGILAGLIASLYGTLVFQDAMILKSVIVFPFLAGALLRLTHALESGKKTHFAQAGLLLGIAVCGRGNLLFALPLLALWIVFRVERPGRGRALREAVLFLVGAAFAIAPVTTRNRLVAGDWVLTESDAGINLYVGNHPGASGIHSPPPEVRSVPEHEEEDARRYAESIEGRSLRPSEVSSFWIRRAVRFAVTHPGKELRLILLKFRLALNGYEVPDNYNQYYFARISPLFSGFLPSFLSISPFAAIGFFFGMKRWRRIGHLHLFVCAYFFSLLVFYITSRYRLPIVIGMIPFAAHGIFLLATFIGRRAVRDILLSLLLAAVMIVLGISSIARHHGFAKQETEIALFHARRGEITLAEESFRRAVADGDRSELPLIYMNLSSFYSSLGRTDEAIRACENALREAPDFAPAQAELERLRTLRESIGPP